MTLILTLFLLAFIFHEPVNYWVVVLMISQNSPTGGTRHAPLRMNQHVTERRILTRSSVLEYSTKLELGVKFMVWFKQLGVLPPQINSVT